MKNPCETVAKSPCTIFLICVQKLSKIKEEKWDDNKVGGDNMGLFGTEAPTSVAAQCDQVLMAARSSKA